MLQVTEMERTFLFERDGVWVSLDDPDPKKSPGDVLNFYAHTYPVLVTAVTSGVEIVNDQMQYKFLSTIGTKG